MTTSASAPFDFLNGKEYENGFCGCLMDPISCLASFCVPCFAVGHTTGVVEKKGFNIWSCLCWPIGAYRNRRAIQAEKVNKESEDGSMCAVGLLPCCAIAQDMHEAGRKTGPAMAEAAEPAAVAEPVREEAKKEEAKAEEAKKDEGEAAPKK